MAKFKRERGLTVSALELLRRAGFTHELRNAVGAGLLSTATFRIHKRGCFTTSATALEFEMEALSRKK